MSTIAAYDPFIAQLAELKQHNATLVFDYNDPKGNEAARSHVYKLRRTKSAVDKVRQAEKAQSLEYGRQVDSQAKAIMSELEGMIEIHAKPLDEIEQREKARKDRHLDALQALRDAAAATIYDTAAVIERAIIKLRSEVPGPEWEEFMAEATKAHTETSAILDRRLADMIRAEAEQAELLKLRQEQADRERREREERIASEAAAKAKAEAERQAMAEREAAAKRELELKAAAERAEKARLESEQRAEQERKASAEREQRAAQEAEAKAKREQKEATQRAAAETARREADKAHRAEINNAAVAALVNGGLDEASAKQAVTLIAKKAVPNVEIRY